MEDWRAELLEEKGKRKPKKKKDLRHGLPPLGTVLTDKQGYEWTVQDHVIPDKNSKSTRGPLAHISANRVPRQGMWIWRRVSPKQIKERDFGHRPEILKEFEEL